MRMTRMFDDIKIIFHPDPRLREKCRKVEAFDDSLKLLAGRMFELMREHHGVGLAAPQVGQTIRMFVMNHSGKPEDDRVYVNPVLSDPDGDDEAEEGCLSLPGINIDVLRSNTMHIRAHDLEGKPFEQTETGYIARIWQHEIDHLNGILLLNHMGPVQKLAWRKRLRELEADYDAAKKKK